MMEVRPYSSHDKGAWDEFVLRSKNGTFLFLRDYMEYHRDRFSDASLIVTEEGGGIVALLPANRSENKLVSHGGLTYGGFISDQAMKMPLMLEVFAATFAHLASAGIDTIVYKTIPYIYHRAPAEEDRYALFLSNARLIRRGAMATVAAHERLPFQQRRTRGAKKAVQKGVSVSETEDFAAYWHILTERLSRVHNARPVHSLDEIESLHRKFPGNIRLFAAVADNEMLGGVVIHETERVARAQYIAASDRGQELGALDLIFTELLSGAFATKPYFDFGTSDHEDGRKLNRGLVDQKEGYGARMVAHDHYEIRIADSGPAVFRDALT